MQHNLIVQNFVDLCGEAFGDVRLGIIFGKKSREIKILREEK